MIWTCAVYGEAATSMRVTCGRAQSSRFTSLALWPVLDLGPAMRLPLPSRLSRAKLKLAAARRCALTEPLTEYCIKIKIYTVYLYQGYCIPVAIRATVRCGGVTAAWRVP